MIFLNPTILFGLLAASIPLLIHLLNLRKIKKIEFSTLAFLKELQKNKIKKIKIKQWLLLLLRTLIILLLVSAFARPTLKTFSLGGAESTAKTSAVFLIDNSLSMGYFTEKGSYFNQCKQMIKKIIEELKDGDDVSLISTASGNVLLDREKSLKYFKGKLSNINITDSKSNMAYSLKLASAILTSSQNYNKELYILTDLQKSNFSQSEIKKVFSKITVDNRVKLYLFDVHNGTAENTAITKFNSTNQIFVQNKIVNFEAVVTNYSPKSITNNVISLFINGKRSAQQSVNLSAGESKLIKFKSKLITTGLTKAVVQLEDDFLNADNYRYLGIFVPKIIKVVIYSAKYKDAKYVKAALLNNYTNNIDVTVKKPEEYSLNSINNYSVTIFIGSEGFDFRMFKSRNSIPKSLMIFPAAQESSNSFAEFIKLFGIEKTNGIVKLKNNYSNFNTIDFNHPVFMNLFENKETIKIQSPNISKYVKILTAGTINPIISLYDNSIFLGEINSGERKLLFFSVAPTLEWSNFPLKGIFAPLIERSVDYLYSNHGIGNNILAGNPVAVEIKNLIIPNIKVVLPDGNEDFFPVAKLKRQSFYNYTNTEKSGIYQFFSGNELIDFASVNGEPTESRTEYLNRKSFAMMMKKADYNNKIINISNNSQLKEIIHKSRFGTELWRLFLVLALLAAILEMMISRSSKKDLGELTT